MTLILTAVCKDGVAICADKRRTIKKPGTTTYTDDLKKVYRFAKVQALSFNHGINRIKGKMWDQYLSDFETTQVHDGMAFPALIAAFAAYMQPPVAQELSANPFDDCVGFVFCALTANGKPLVRELFWKRNISLEEKTYQGLVRTGNGAEHLESHLKVHPDVNTVNHWSGRNTNDALSDLKDLFAVASEERKRLAKEDFSDTFDMETLK